MFLFLNSSHKLTVLCLKNLLEKNNMIMLLAYPNSFLKFPILKGNGISYKLGLMLASSHPPVLQTSSSVSDFTFKGLSRNCAFLIKIMSNPGKSIVPFSSV